MVLIAGTKLGPYEILGPLGAGGMGEVYRARDPVLDRDVAIKVLLALVSSDSERLRRFEQEARAAAGLNHPNILAIFQMGSYEGVPYLVSELLQGETLRELLQAGPLPVRKALDYGQQMLRGLAAAHEHGIVHRDLKPENIFVTNDGRVKILDFGLAKLRLSNEPGSPQMTTLAPQTEPGVVMGTVGYMSPEQVKDSRRIARSDLFSFGAILCEMLTGNRAFQKATSVETMTAILNEDPPGLLQMTPNVSPGLQRIVHRCLEKSPDQRFQSASDLAFALGSLLSVDSSSTFLSRRLDIVEAVVGPRCSSCGRSALRLRSTLDGIVPEIRACNCRLRFCRPRARHSGRTIRRLRLSLQTEDFWRLLPCVTA